MRSFSRRSMVLSSASTSSSYRRPAWGLATAFFPATITTTATTVPNTLHHLQKHQRLLFVPRWLDQPPSASFLFTPSTRMIIHPMSLKNHRHDIRFFSSVMGRGGACRNYYNSQVTSPHQALAILEGTTVPVGQRRWLLKVVTTSGLFRLLERATRNCFDTLQDAECLGLLVEGWALHSAQVTGSGTSTSTSSTSSSSKETKEKKGSNSITGAVVAAHLLNDWQKQSIKNPGQPSPPTVLVYNSVLGALAKEGRYELAGKLLEQMMDRDDNGDNEKRSLLEPNRESFLRVLHACCNAGVAVHCRQWLERMKTFSSTHNKDVTPDVTTYNILLQTYVNQRNPGLGLEAYRLLKEMPVEPDQTSYNITLNVLAEEGNYEMAQELFEKLLFQQTHSNGEADDSLENLGRSFVDPIALGTVLKACFRAQSVVAAERAEALVTNLLPHQHALLADASTYTTVVSIWCHRGHPERAQIVLEKLLHLYSKFSSDARFKPDEMCFQMMVGAYSHKIGRLLSSSNGQLTGKQKNRHLDKYDNRSMEHAVELAERAQLVLMHMYHTVGYTPNLLTCNSVLNCWSQACQPQAAEDFLQIMLEWNIPPDIVTYNTIIACHSKLGNVSNCTAWLSKLSSESPPSDNTSSHFSSYFPTPNTRTVTSVITALSKQCTLEAAEEAEAWFLLMQDWHAENGWDCAPNQVTWNALLTCWARVGDGPRAESIFRRYQQAFQRQKRDRVEETLDPPNIITYNIVLQGYVYESNSNNNKHSKSRTNSELVSKVRALLDEIISFGLQPNDRTFELAKRALSCNSDPRGNASGITSKLAEWERRYFSLTLLTKKNDAYKAGGQPRNQRDFSNQKHKAATSRRGIDGEEASVHR